MISNHTMREALRRLDPVTQRKVITAFHTISESGVLVAAGEHLGKTLVTAAKESPAEMAVNEDVLRYELRLIDELIEVFTELGKAEGEASPIFK